MAQWNERVVSQTIALAASAVDQQFFQAVDGTYVIDGLSLQMTTAASSGASAVVDLKVCPPGTAPTSGTSALAATMKLETTLASGTLTSDTTAPVTASTVTIGAVTYTFRTALSTNPTIPYEVLIGISAAVALDNLKSAINATSGAGTTYGLGTDAHPLFTATTNTDTTQLIVARHAGTSYNGIGTTVSVSPDPHAAWGATTTSGGLGFDLNTSTAAVLSGTPSALIIPKGSSAALDFGGTQTNLTGLNINLRVTRTTI